jgi:hypothetical protein
MKVPFSRTLSPRFVVVCENIPGMGEEGIKKNDGGCEFNYDIF